MFKIAVCDRRSAEDVANEFGVTHVISLVDPGTELPVYDCEHAVMYFVDTERRDHENCPTEEHVARILEIGESLTDDHRVLVHCEAGISRSTAAAFILMAQHMGPDRASEAADLLKKIRLACMPNSLMVEHAEELLGCVGKLLPISEDLGDFRLISRMAAEDD